MNLPSTSQSIKLVQTNIPINSIFINTLICIINFVIVIIPLEIWINKKLDWYSLGKSAVYVFGIWFGASAVVAIIKYFVSKDDNK